MLTKFVLKLDLNHHRESRKLHKIKYNLVHIIKPIINYVGFRIINFFNFFFKINYINNKYIL